MSELKNTCVSMSCPFVGLCNQYNFLIDRGESCEYQDQLLRAAKRLQQQRKMIAKYTKMQEEKK